LGGRIKKAFVPQKQGQKLKTSAVPPKLMIKKSSTLLHTIICTLLITDRGPVDVYSQMMVSSRPRKSIPKNLCCRLYTAGGSLDTPEILYSSYSKVSLISIYYMRSGAILSRTIIKHLDCDRLQRVFLTANHIKGNHIILLDSN
jgi:hypothetical protein